MTRERSEASGPEPSASIDPELPSTHGRPPVDARILLAISAGGAAGTALRYALGRLLPTATDAFPWTTLAVNLSGSFVLGAFLAWLLARRAGDRHLRPFVAVGFLGGYTTFSTAMVESALLLKDGAAGLAIGYLALGVVGGVLATAAGIVLTRRVAAC